MVSHGRRRTSGASPHADALTPVQLRQTARCRKQTLTAKLSDSGFEEDHLDASSPGSSTAPVPPEVSPLRAEELPTWFLQYGDEGYLTQREKEMNFQPCRSLARQPQVGHTSCYCRWMLTECKGPVRHIYDGPLTDGHQVLEGKRVIVRLWDQFHISI